MKELKQKPTGTLSAKEVFIEMLEILHTQKDLGKLESCVCSKWCNFGALCDPERCRFHRALAIRLKEVKLLEENEKITKQSAKAFMKSRTETTNRHKTTNILIGALRRSVTCMKKTCNEKEISILLKIEENLKKRVDIPKVKYYAKYYKIATLLAIFEKHAARKAAKKIKEEK